MERHTEEARWRKWEERELYGGKRGNGWSEVQAVPYRVNSDGAWRWKHTEQLGSAAVEGSTTYLGIHMSGIMFVHKNL